MGAHLRWVPPRWVPIGTMGAALRRTCYVRPAPAPILLGAMDVVGHHTRLRRGAAVLVVVQGRRPDSTTPVHTIGGRHPHGVLRVAAQKRDE
jgi:hypothetical protein